MIWQGDTQYASPNYASRSILYSVSGLPHAEFGGYLSAVGGGGDMYPTYLNRYNIINNLDSPITISKSADIIGDQIIMSVDTEVVGDITTTNNKVQFILTNHQDDEYFCSVISYHDQSFPSTEIGQSEHFESSVTINPSWDINDFKFVSIVQSFSNDHILQASSTTIPLTNLLILDSSIDGIVNDNDGDGVANPGESADLLINISNISMELDTQDINIVITSNSDEISFPSGNDFQISPGLDNGQNQHISVPISIDSDIPLGDVSFTINLIADYIDNYNNSFTYSKFYYPSLSVNLYQSNFPFITSSQIIGSPVIIDVNGDNNKEYIFGDYAGFVHIVDAFGQEIEGFPYEIGDQIWGAPAVADMDHDGDLEIVVSSMDKHLYILNTDGTLQVNYNTGKFLMATPAIGNIDGDDDLEVIIGGYSSSNKIFAVNPDGSAVDGFPVSIGEKVQRGVALADINGNGRDDIIFGTDSENLYLMYDDGTIAPGFPFETDGDIRVAPLVIEESDGYLFVFGTKGNVFYGVDSSGNQRFMLEIDDDVTVSPSPVDIEGNGTCIFFGDDDGLLHGIDLNGNTLSGWPQQLEGSVVSSPVFSDFNGDEIPEVVTSTEDGMLYIFSIDGTPYGSSPFSYDFPFSGNISILDTDSDQDLEIVAGTADALNVYDIKENNSFQSYWSLFRGNYKRNGLYSISSDVLYGDVNHDAQVDVMDIIIMVNYVIGTTTEIDIDAADFNQDNTIDVLDIVAVLNFILN